MSRRDFLYRVGLIGAGVGMGGCGAVRLVKRESNLEEEFKPQYPQTSSRGRAVIINGDDSEFRHLENVVRAERFLLGIGYGSQDISVLSPPYEAFSRTNVEQLRRSAEFGGGFPLPTIQGPATMRNVEVTLESLMGGISVEQELFVYITGHGGVDEKTKESIAQLNAPYAKNSYNQLSDRRLKELLTKGDKKYNGVVIFDGCNGEGFADVVGGGNITAITKSKKGQVDSCVFFANEFFHMPFNRGLRNKGKLMLADAVTYTGKQLKEGGAEAHITMKGDYNPQLREVVDAQPMMFSMFMPNSEVKMQHIPLMYQLEEEQKVMIVRNDQMYMKALAEPHALFYIQAEGCGGCEIVSSLLAERLEEKEKRVPVYVFANTFDNDKVKFSNHAERLEKDLGIQVTSVPLLLRYERGRVVSAYDGIPSEVCGYGTLPDKYILIPSREKMDRLLRL